MKGTRDASPGDGPGLDATAFDAVEDWSKAWFVSPAGDDRLSFDELPVGWALHVEIFAAVLAAVHRSLGRPERLVGRPLFKPLRRRGLDRAIRAWGLRAVGTGRAHPRPGALAIVSELATPSALDASLAVAGRMAATDVAVAAGDPRALLRWRDAGHVPTPLVLGPLEELRLLRRARRKLTERWPAAQREAPPLLIRGVNLTRVALAAATPIVTRGGPWLAAEAAAIDRFLGLFRPRAALLASDQHRLGRLTVHLARVRHVPTSVLQHGLPQATLGYVPVVADRVLAWSRDAATWFEARGTPADKLLVVGNPRLDAFVGRPADGSRPAPPEAAMLRGSPRLLVAISVAPEEVNVELVRVAIECLRAMPAASLIVKLHPGGSNWGAVRAAVGSAVASERVRIVERVPLEPLLRWSDIVVVHRSTVAGEALAAGRPVIAIAGPSPSIARLELRDLALPEAKDGLDLARLVAELMRPAIREAFLRTRREALEQVMGPLDGLATDRIVRLLAETGAPESDGST